MLQLHTDRNNESVCIMKGDMALNMLLDSSAKKSDYFFNTQKGIDAIKSTPLSVWIEDINRALASRLITFMHKIGKDLNWL